MSWTRMTIGLALWTVVLSTLPARGAEVEEPETIPERSISFSYDYEEFDGSLSSWHEASIQYAHKFDKLSLLGRINRADRFDRIVEQFEIDAYPKFRNAGMWAYLNVGYSSSGIYPEWRAGAELYKSLPRSFAASLGLRYLEFQTTDVFLYTGSIEKYKGNYLFIVRPYLKNNPEGVSASAHFEVRKYGATARDFNMFRIGYGESPEPDVVPDEITQLQSWSVRIGKEKPVTKKFILKGKLGYRDVQLTPTRHRRSFFTTVGFQRIF